MMTFDPKVVPALIQTQWWGFA